ncbi:hypothetical protein ZIOFF_036854 [Zingiber officinale]|uniref:Uncharacterized protein n=1 Tax=Zingiber officinale TaxID=94328 RepID=A0A8J5L8G0_ZINOF|nr:hypothetical protein ZIOFF_036854 [Zingiber officinale]
MQDKAGAEDGEKETFSKKPRHCQAEMPLTDSEEDSFLFPVKEIVQYPLPVYVAPSSISFIPDGCLISYLFSPDGTLHCKVFAFEVASQRQELVICSPDGGGLDESNLSAEEKLRRERLRERALGVTRYEWKSRSMSSSCFAPGKPTIMVPLPNGLFCVPFCGCGPPSELPSFGLLLWSTSIRRDFDRHFYILWQGFRSFVWTAISYQMKDVLKLSSSSSHFLVSVAHSPWSIKPIYG